MSRGCGLPGTLLVASARGGGGCTIALAELRGAVRCAYPGYEGYEDDGWHFPRSRGVWAGAATAASRRTPMLRFLVVPALLALCGLARAQSCGDVLLHDVVLTHDLSCTAWHPHGLAAGASGITIDLGGHTLEGTFGIGVAVTGASGVKVRNGRIRGFGGGISGGAAHGLIVEEVVFEDMHNGITLDDTASATLRGNRFDRLGG